jgi:hypothetical protein
MEQQTHVSSNLTGAQPNHGLGTKGSGFHLEALVHPWRVFTHPSEVLAHPAFSKQEKRAVLASWASDAYAVESAPALRCPPGSETPVPLADIMGALRTLDTEGHALHGDNAQRPRWLSSWRPTGWPKRAFSMPNRLRWLPSRRRDQEARNNQLAQAEL